MLIQIKVVMSMYPKQRPLSLLCSWQPGYHDRKVIWVHFMMEWKWVHSCLMGSGMGWDMVQRAEADGFSKEKLVQANVCLSVYHSYCPALSQLWSWNLLYSVYVLEWRIL